MKPLLKVKKSLGQNFLVDNNIIKKIVDIGNVNKNKTVIPRLGLGLGLGLGFVAMRRNSLIN